MARIRQIPIPIYGKQQRFRQSQAFIRGFVAGRGSGKTKVGALDVLLRAKDGEPWMGVSPSYSVIEDTTWPVFRETAESLGVWIRGTKSPTPRAHFRTQDGGTSQIVFRSGDKPDTLRGPSKAGLWFDEASVMHADCFKYGIPVLRHKGKMGSCLMTFTPKGKRHWTFETFYEPSEDWLQSLLSEAAGDDGASLADHYQCVNIGGRFYRKKKSTDLIHAHTLENPFLPPEYFDLISGHYTKALAAQELGGEFIELEGLMFRREWFGSPVEMAPRRAVRVRYWDRAATHGSGSYSAGVLMAMAENGLFYIEDVVRGQWSAFDRDQIIIQTAERDAQRYGNEVIIYTEQEGGSGGKEVAAQMVRKLAGFPVYRDIVSSGRRTRVVDKMSLPGEAKIIRAMPLAAQAEAGNVRLIRGTWNEDYLEELAAFPEFAFSDQVDGSSGAFNKLAGKSPLDMGEVERVTPELNSERFGALLLLNRSRNRKR